mmetsp:Transcript_26589/g.61084  ORF Transcript_26589/g.61084 Transcript_26589/m.61084 type:complete len:92 (+) Transcript_26589:956-1231(+)
MKMITRGRRVMMMQLQCRHICDASKESMNEESVMAQRVNSEDQSIDRRVHKSVAHEKERDFSNSNRHNAPRSRHCSVACEKEKRTAVGESP